MEKAAPGSSPDKFILRMPEGLRDRIAANAKANNRSMNSEIIARIENSFRNDVSGRLRWLLDEVKPGWPFPKLSPSLIAEEMGESKASPLENVFAGIEEPTFDMLNRLAEYFGVRAEWLKRAIGNPFPVEHEGSYDLNFVDRLLLNNPKKVFFVREDSANGSLAIVMQYDAFRCLTLETNICISENIGATGEGNLARFSNVCRKLWKFHKELINGVQMPIEPFDALISGAIHPLTAINLGQRTHWIEDWWDPAMFRERNDEDQYWIGYRKFCERIYKAVELNDFLRREKDSISASV